MAKVTAELLHRFEKMIETQFPDGKAMRCQMARYQEQNLSETLFLWDLWYSCPSVAITPLMKEAYAAGCVDTQITAALMQCVKSLYGLDYKNSETQPPGSGGV